MNAIEVNHVSKCMNHFRIQDLHFSVPKGYITGFIGQNGSGKTTTIQLIMDIIRADHGEIKLFDTANDVSEVKQRVGFVYDDLYMYENITIHQMQRFIAPLYHTWNDNLFERYRRKFQLPKKQKIKEFSKGMKMKTSLLFALAHDPELLIMDEPTSGLDPVFRRELMDLFQELMLESERTIFFSTHITSDLDRLADYILLIENGQIMLQKQITEIEDEFHLVKGTEEQLCKIGKELFVGVRESSQGFTALFQGNMEQITEVQDLVIEKPTLADIMYFIKNEGSA